LIASGHEGGFHTAWQPIHTMTLLPDVIEKCSDENTLVCGTGGFCDGKSMAAAFAMGADGVQMGTRFLATEESDFAPLWKQMVLDAKDGGTLIARGFVGPARWLRTETTLRHAKNTLRYAPGSYLGIPDDYTTIPEDLIHAENFGLNATRVGDIQNAMAAAGECAQRITDLPKTSDMMRSVMADTEEILRRVASKYVVG
jgi:NAD(P)H-dependent flavin oxidoreductase YrpB (nitropropane dioxygenase family)